MQELMNPRSQLGLTLIEVLVVLIIMAIGLLGVAGMQAGAVRQTTSSGFQTQAMFLAQDLVERIRANRDAVVDGDDSVVNLTAYTKGPGEAFPTAEVAACSGTSGCGANDMAQSDLFAWQMAIRNSLPVSDDVMSDEIYVCLDSNPDDGTPCDGLGSTAMVRLAWLDSSFQTDGAGVLTQDNQVHAYQMTFEP